MYGCMHVCMYLCMTLFEDETNTIRHPICIQGSYLEHIGHKSTDDTLFTCIRASDISRGRGPAKFRYFHEIPRNSQKNTKYREIRRKYFQIHVGKTYLILILAIRPVLFTPNIQIYLEISSLQRVNNVPKLPGVFR